MMQQVKQMYVVGRADDFPERQFSLPCKKIRHMTPPEPLYLPVLEKIMRNAQPIVQLHLSIIENLRMRMHVIPAAIVNALLSQVFQCLLPSAFHIYVNVPRLSQTT